VGPQIYPYLERKLVNGNSINAYFKFSPLKPSGDSISLSNREISGGMGYVNRLKSGHPLNFNIDYAQLQFQAQSSSISQSTFVLSSGYGF
jgi:hypothetical protein